jgi:porphobilinogen synthase
VRETSLSPADLVQPLFVAERDGDAGEIAALPGVRRHSLESLDREVDQLARTGVPAVLLFGVPAAKDPLGAGAAREDGIVPKAVRRIRERALPLLVFTDVCLCSYTDHGHCGVVRGEEVDNDLTLPRLAETALAHARAGADLVAPSAMMDGTVGALRAALDGAGLPSVGILSYAVKYASCFYGPFRQAAESVPRFGDRRAYQMDPANAREALAEARLDLEEGADMIMVKPALPCLDVLRRVRDGFPEAPLAAYQVSGEYGMIKAAAEKGWLDERRAVLESLTAIKRAGADAILTYFARDAAAWLRP